MRKKTRASLFLIAIVILGTIACLLLLATSNTTAMYPAFPWHVTGRVTDGASNALGGVRVVAEGDVRITLMNKIEGTAIKTFHEETMTDTNGGFMLQFEACSFELSFTKSGYSSQTTNFYHSPSFGQKTNQMLEIVLDKEPR
jgi:hypothetical protein